MRLALTKRSGDAIRILFHLAALPPGTRRTSIEIAEASGVSRGNIPTLVAALSRAGILDCTRGPGGGCALARPAAQIDMAEAVTAVEGSLEPEHCALDDIRCRDRPYPCGMHHTWATVVRTLTDELGGLSLEQALRNDEKNRQAAARTHHG